MKDDEIFRSLMSKLDSGVYFVDQQRRIRFWNKEAERLTGYKAERVIGTLCSDNLLRHITSSGVQLCLQGCPLTETMESCQVKEVEAYMHNASGSRVPVLVMAAPLVDESDAPIGAVEIFSDRSDKDVLLSELELLRNEVLTDPLTGLGNRRYLSIMADARFRSLAPKGKAFSLLMADIDHFKRVNDNYGHSIGDKVLKMVALTLASVVNPLDAAVRWGGEEFVILYPSTDMEELAETAERMRLMVERSWIDLDDNSTLNVTISVGASIARHGDTVESTIARADARLYQAKENGRNRSIVGE
jgi:diguanylate cyclase (GGDEF)-like protein/PAS domain S-box-containing protein